MIYTATNTAILKPQSSDEFSTTMSSHRSRSSSSDLYEEQPTSPLPSNLNLRTSNPAAVQQQQRRIRGGKSPT